MLTSVHVFPTVQGVPSPRLSIKCSSLLPCLCPGCSGDRGGGAMMEGDYQDWAIIRVHCYYRQPSLGVFCVPPSFIFAPAKFNYLDINCSCKGGLIFDVVSDLRFVSATKQCLNKSGAALPVGDPNISHQNPGKHGVIICSSWAELMVSGFHFLL